LEFKTFLAGTGYPTGKNTCAGTGMGKILYLRVYTGNPTGIIFFDGYGYGMVLPDGYVPVAIPSLLRRDAFAWDDDAITTFHTLKHALTTGPVLQMPNFAKLFVVDCDASGAGFGVVLHQGAGPLAYFSKPFAARHLKLAAYERELIGLVQAVRH
jgi:hypothetical protein